MMQGHRDRLTLVCGRVGGPDGFQSVEQFVHPGSTAAEVPARGFVLLGRPADAEPRQQTTTAYQVDAGQRPGQLHRRIQGGDEYVSSEEHALGGTRGDTQEHEGVGGRVQFGRNGVALPAITDLRVDSSEVAVANPQTGSPCILDLPGELGGPGDAQGLLVELRERETDLHGCSFSSGGRRLRQSKDVHHPGRVGLCGSVSLAAGTTRLALYVGSSNVCRRLSTPLGRLAASGCRRVPATPRPSVSAVP